MIKIELNDDTTSFEKTISELNAVFNVPVKKTVPLPCSRASIAKIREECAKIKRAIKQNAMSDLDGVYYLKKINAGYSRLSASIGISEFSRELERKHLSGVFK